MIVKGIRYTFYASLGQTNATHSAKKISWKRSFSLESFIHVYSDWKWFGYFLCVMEMSQTFHELKKSRKTNKQLKSKDLCLFVWFHLFDDIEWLLQWCVKHIKDVRHISNDWYKNERSQKRIQFPSNNPEACLLSSSISRCC